MVVFVCHSYFCVEVDSFSRNLMITPNQSVRVGERSIQKRKWTLLGIFSFNSGDAGSGEPPDRKR